MRVLQNSMEKEHVALEEFEKTGIIDQREGSQHRDPSVLHKRNKSDKRPKNK